MRICFSQPCGFHERCSCSSVTPSDNSFVGVVSDPGGSVEPSPTTPHTEAALSPRLLEILQYHESTRKRTLNDNRTTTTSSLLENQTNAPVSWTSKQRAIDGIMQRFSGGGQVQRVPSPSPPLRSESVNTIGDESWHTTETTFQDQTKPNPPGSEVAIPKAPVQTAGSSPTTIGGSENKFSTPTNLEISYRVSGTRDSRGDGDGRKSHDFGKPGPRHISPLRRPHSDSAAPNLKPLGTSPTERRSLSVRGKGERAILAIVPCDQSDLGIFFRPVSRGTIG